MKRGHHNFRFTYCKQTSDAVWIGIEIKIKKSISCDISRYIDTVIYKYHHSTKLYRKISQVCCRSIVTSAKHE